MIIDLHCDTFYRMYKDKKNISAFEKNEYHIDINKLKKGKVLGQCFAIYNAKENEYNSELMYEVIDYMLRVFNNYQNQILIYSKYRDFKEASASKKIAAIPTIEDLGPVNGDISQIDKLNKLGIKMASITWNHENTLGYPNSDNKETMRSGLKKFGIEVIEKMNDLKIIVDISHLSDGGFYDVAEHSKRPFIASHSNAREIAKHSRNLTDEMIKMLSDAGGIMGINFYSKFLSDTAKSSRVSDIISHIKYIRKVGGIDCIAIGTDFDGIEDELEISDASKHFILIEALEREKFTTREIEKITSKNVMRVFREIESNI